MESPIPRRLVGRLRSGRPFVAVGDRVNVTPGELRPGFGPGVVAQVHNATSRVADAVVSFDSDPEELVRCYVLRSHVERGRRW